MSRSILMILFVITISAAPVCAQPGSLPGAKIQRVYSPEQQQELSRSFFPNPRLTALIAAMPEFLGGDGLYSIPLTEERILFVFGDTFVANPEAADDRRQAGFVNNTLALCYLNQNDSAEIEIERLEFIDDSKLLPFFKPQITDSDSDGDSDKPETKRFYWPLDGIMTSAELALFAVEISLTGNEAFDFRPSGNILELISNPLDPPADWQRQRLNIPFCRESEHEHLIWGAAVTNHRQQIYIYGYFQHRSRERYLVLARASETAIADFDSWEFLTDDGDWSNDFDNHGIFRSAITTEFSVIAPSSPLSRSHGLNWLMITSTGGGIGGGIEILNSPTPDFTNARRIALYPTPEHDLDRGVFTYSAKLLRIPTLDNSIPLVYFHNTFEPEQLYRDTWIYYPQIVHYLPDTAGTEQ